MRLQRRPVQGFSTILSKTTVGLLCLLGCFASAQDEVPVPVTTVVISVAEQKLVVLRDGGWIKKFPISTSKFGLGDAYGSYKTPLGKHRVCEKIGNDLTPGTVFKQRHATGEILPVNAPGRDPIVTRILWLDGLEPQNANARPRGIYIHGTIEEAKIGEPVSYGCIRMRSKDVMEVFDEVPLDTQVDIIAEKFPKFPKYTPPKPRIIAKNAPPTPAPATPALVAAKKEPTPATPATPPPVAIAQTKPEMPAKAEPVRINSGANVVLQKPEPPAPPLNPGASLALKGSILDAGLPEGPTMLPKPTEPKDVPRFGGLDASQPGGAGLTLQSQPPEPEAAAPAPASSTKKSQAASSDAAKPPSKIAFRSNNSMEKPKR